MRRPKQLRIGMVLCDRGLLFQRCVDAIYREADRHKGLLIRRFDSDGADFQRNVVQPLQQWQPHGVIVRIEDPNHLRRLRRHLPGVPIVSTIGARADLVDVRVAGSAVEGFVVAQGYFRQCGVLQVAQFCAAEENVNRILTAAFRDVVPNGTQVICPSEVFEARTRAHQRRRDALVSKALRKMQKPVGIVTLETRAGRYLLELCQSMGYRVPADIQIIGMDDEDECLACEPQLTSLTVPSKVIGRVAMQLVLDMLAGKQPPAVVRVPGTIVVPRGSTQLPSRQSRSSTQVLDLMRVHATKGVSIARVIKMSGMGQTAFYKCVAAATGRTPAEHLRQLRLEEARRMLRETGETVTAIAAACGYGSRVYFTQSFRHETGQTPMAYRRATAGRKDAAS